MFPLIESRLHAQMKGREAVRYLQRAVSTERSMASRTPRGSGSSTHGTRTPRGGGGTRTPRGGGGGASGGGTRTPRSGGSVRPPRAFSSERHLVVASPDGIVGVSARQQDMSDSALLRLRRQYEDKLARERAAVRRKEEELEEGRTRANEEAHKQAMCMTTKNLAKLRSEQRQQLSVHHRMHQFAEHERAATMVKEAQMAEAHRAELFKARAEAKAAAEARAAQLQREQDERHEKQVRELEERLKTAAMKRTEAALEAARQEREHSEQLQAELDELRADASSGFNLLDKARRERDEAVREAVARGHEERLAAVHAERRQWEQVRHNQLQAEAIRSETVLQKSRSAEETAKLASDAMQMAEETRARAEASRRRVEEERRSLADERAQLDALRAHSLHELDRSHKVAREAEAGLALMRAALEEQKKLVKQAQAEAAQERHVAQQVAAAGAAADADAASSAEGAAARAVAKAAGNAGATDTQVQTTSTSEQQPQQGPAWTGSRAPASPTTSEVKPALDEQASRPSSFTLKAVESVANVALASAPGKQQQHGAAAATKAHQSTSPQRQQQSQTPPQQQISLSPERPDRTHRTSADGPTSPVLRSSAEGWLEQQVVQLQSQLEQNTQQRAQLTAALKQAAIDKSIALDRLRKAFATRVETRVLEPAMVSRSLSIAATEVSPALMAAREGALFPTAYLEVVGATYITAGLATVLGFGADGSDVEVLAVHLGSSLFALGAAGLGSGRSRGGAQAVLGSAVAVRLGTAAAGRSTTAAGTLTSAAPAPPQQPDGRWVVKYMLEPSRAFAAAAAAALLAGETSARPRESAPAAAADAAAACCGIKQVTLATREGLVVARNEIDLQQRPADVLVSRRYDYRAVSQAALVLQRTQRGRAGRDNVHMVRLARTAERVAERPKAVRRGRRSTNEM